MTLDIRGLVPLLQVFDMPTSIHFYRDILGFEVVNTSGPGEHFGWALLRLNGHYAALWRRQSGGFLDAGDMLAAE